VFSPGRAPAAGDEGTTTKRRLSPEGRLARWSVEPELENDDMTTHPATFLPDPSTGGGLVTADARTLPLAGASLAVDAGGGLARVVLEQRFRNPHAEPLEVTYSLPLPADAAVSGFAFRIGVERIVGEIDKRANAKERFERAIVEGRGAALVEQDRSSLFTQRIGNVPPGEEVVAEITIDQKLAWLDEGAWEWRFPTTVAPRYLGAPGRVADAPRVHQDVADAPMPVRMSLAMRVRDELDGGRPESPSHALRAEADRVAFAAEGGVPLDRDVVVRWTAAQAEASARIEVAPSKRGDVYALLTVVPPARTKSARTAPIARDVTLLLDVSGSMSGEPIAQAKRVVSALVSTLEERDTLEMIAFSSSPRRWKRHAERMTPDARRAALGWIDALAASGGTEMRHAIEEALAPLRGDGQRQVVLVTDGQIGFESEIVATIAGSLPASSRVHVVGVGSAPNRTLTAHAARAGRGTEVIVGIGEDPERAARRLVARTDAPVVVELTIAGDAAMEHAPRALPDLFAGAPALVALRVRPEGGEVVVRGRTAGGAWERRLRVRADASSGSAAIPALWARERVEDIETDVAAGGDARDLESAIERIGLDFGIATRLTSWVAVSEKPAVDPRDPARRVRMPHELPHGMSAEGLGLRSAFAAGAVGGGFAHALAAPMRPAGSMGHPSPPMARSYAAVPRQQGLKDEGAHGGADQPADEKTRVTSVIGRVMEVFKGRATPPPPPAAAPAPAAPPMVAAGPTGQRQAEPLRGRIAVREKDAILIEIEAGQRAFAWAPGDEVTVTWADGTTSHAKVIAVRCTRNGAIAAGSMVRLCFAVDVAENRTPVVVAIESQGATLVVVLA
jgi:Ca-activated chloride channel homolog